VLEETQRQVLEALARSTTTACREVVRARALLLAAEGRANTAIGAELGVSPTSGTQWRERFAAEGLTKLAQVRKGRGRKPTIAKEKVD
jgi:transposase